MALTPCIARYQIDLKYPFMVNYIKNYHKRLLKFAVTFLLIFFLVPGFTSEGDDPADASTSKYLKSLGDYLGYDLTQDTATLSDTLLSYTLNVVAANSTGENILYAMLRSIPINSTFATFFTNTPYDSFNAETANKLFAGYANNGSSSSNSISATENFDQKEWQNDPVSQAVLNLVGTPNLTTCPENATDASSTSSCLSSYQVMLTALSSILGDDKELPGEYEYMKYTSNTSQFISQLNSNNLIGPMVYSTSGASKNGFPSGSQLQQAQAFIRYATEGVLPLPTMAPTDYSKLRTLAYPPTDSNGNVGASIDIPNMNSAKVALASYLLNLRVYAAKSSVAIGNLYSILAKRMPQSSSGTENNTSSEAVTEFNMATWRLYNPQTKQASDQWAQQINTAAPSAIQKEMAILLSEINYQLYLNRQQQERLILTNSMMLMQLLSMSKPSTDFPSSVNQDADTIPEEPSS